MYALVTGASSGIGRDISFELKKKGYDLILVGRNEERLKEISSQIDNSIYDICDLSNLENVKALWEKYKDYDIEILVNNAGYGECSLFKEGDLDREMNMIDLNVKTLHYLTRKFLDKFDNGYILNVASAAAFAPGPMMATYYSTKSYVYRLSRAISYELKRTKSKVKLSVLCPGPVATRFNLNAGVTFSSKGLKSDKVAKYAVKKMLKGKEVIVPGFSIKCLKFFSHFVSEKFMMRYLYSYQKKSRT